MSILGIATCSRYVSPLISSFPVTDCRHPLNKKIKNMKKEYKINYYEKNNINILLKTEYLNKKELKKRIKELFKELDNYNK